MTIFLNKTLLKSLAIFMLAILSNSALPQSFEKDHLLGRWKCGPHLLNGGEFVVIGIEEMEFLKNNTFKSDTFLTTSVHSGKTTQTRENSFGTWAINSDILKVKYEEVRFMSSSDPAYSLEMGQADTDRQQKIKNWAQYQLRNDKGGLIMQPLNSMYKNANKPMFCKKH